MLKYLTVFIDSCAIEPPVAEEKKAVDEILKLENAPFNLEIQLPESVYEEIKRIDSNRTMKLKINHLVSEEKDLTEEELEIKNKIENLKFIVRS